MTDIDKLGEEVATLIKNAEQDKAKVAPMLRKVWAELEAKRPVNGCASKGAWAQKFGITTRYCQYILRGERGKGSAKKRRTVVRIVELKEGMLVRWHGSTVYKVTRFGVDRDDDEEISLELCVEEYEEQKPAPKKELTHVRSV